MKYCTRCVYPANHPFGLEFDEEGVCSGCRTHEEKDQLNWAGREEKLLKILGKYKDHQGSRHDCIVPVSGGRDSFYIVDLLRRRYNLNPLLVTFNRHYNTRAGIYNLERIRTAIGCEILSETINPDVYRRMALASLKLKGSIHWPYLAGSTVFPVQVAVRRRIPLIIWGAHQGMEQTGMFSHLDEVEMTRRYRKEHDLIGLEPEDMLCMSDDLSKEDLSPLFYPTDDALADVGVRGIYLNNYIRWDTKSQHELMLKRYQYFTGPQLRTFDTYNDVDCAIYSSIHDAIKFRKLGYGKITDHVCREIRHRRLTREQGVDLVRKYNDKSEGNLEKITQWIGLTVEEFWKMVDGHRDETIYEFVDNAWKARDSIANHRDDLGVEKARLESNNLDNKCVFSENHPSGLKGDPYDVQLLMRGYVHP